MTRAVTEQLRGTGHSAGLKWPNDVLLDGGKVCGILAEVVPGHPDAVVIGAGVNTRMTARRPAGRDGDLVRGGRARVRRGSAARRLPRRARRPAHRARRPPHGDAAAAGILGEIEALCTTIGSDVVVSLPDGTKLRGRAQRIDPEGRLVVIDGDLETAVSAGDVVHVR